MIEDEAMTVACVLIRLLPLRPNDEDEGMIVADILMKSRNGWTVDEMVEWLRNMEEIDPSVPEDVALRRMREVEIRVAERIGKRGG